MLTRTWSRVDFAGFQPGPDQVPRRERQTFPHCIVRAGNVSNFDKYVCVYYIQRVMAFQTERALRETQHYSMRGGMERDKSGCA